MKEINDEQIEHLAELSALSLTKAEKVKMKTEIEQILDFVDKLDSVDVNNQYVENGTITLSNLREDIITGSITQKKALSNAPTHENGAFVISKVVD